MTRPTTPSRILAVTIGGLGDAVLFSPVLKALRASHPDAIVHLLVASRLVEEAYASTPEVDHVIFVDTNASSAPARLGSLLLFGVQSRFKHSGFDIGVLATGLNHRLEVFLHTLANVKKIYAAPTSDEFTTDLDCNVTLARCFDPNVSRQSVFLPVTAESRMEAAGMLRRHDISLRGDRIVAIYPSTALPHRPRWPLENLKRLIKRFRQDSHGYKLVVIGSQSEGAEWAATDNEGLVDANLAGKVSIHASATVLKECTLALGNDGGLMHVAGAMNCPLVLISTNTPSNYRPAGENTVIVHSNLSCCREVFPNRPKWCHEAKCSEDISVEDVYKACRRVLRN